MSVIAANKLNEALAKAKDVGLVEESFIMEDCEVTLRNLRPDEDIASLEACEGLDGIEYLHTYQRENLSRSIVVLNGMNLRKVKYVEVEEPDPEHLELTRTVKVELHTYLLKNVVATWGKEAVYTAYRKFADVLERAERKVKKGIEFLTPDETDEERYRRLLLEARECEGELPDTLVDHILDDHGLMRKTTAEEVKAVMERTDQLARETEAEVAPESSETRKAPDVAPPVPKASPTEDIVPEALIPAPPPKKVPVPVRQPLNQPPGGSPVDPHQTLQQAIESRRQAPVQSAQQETTPTSRADKIAALEATGIGATDDAPLPNGEGIPIHRPDEAQEVVEIRKREPMDPKEAVAILDQPPKSGINPRFRPPPKI